MIVLQRAWRPYPSSRASRPARTRKVARPSRQHGGRRSQQATATSGPQKSRSAYTRKPISSDFLPPLDSSLLFPEKSKLPPHFVLASDETGFPPRRLSRGSGVLKEGADQVVALETHGLLEAVRDTRGHLWDFYDRMHR